MAGFSVWSERNHFPIQINVEKYDINCDNGHVELHHNSQTELGRLRRHITPMFYCHGFGMEGVTVDLEQSKMNSVQCVWYTTPKYINHVVYRQKELENVWTNVIHAHAFWISSWCFSSCAVWKGHRHNTYNIKTIQVSRAWWKWLC